MPKNEPANWLPAAIRKAVIRETFEAITAVGFMKWKAEELMGYGYQVGEEDRQHYFKMYEQDHFADFQKMAATAPDDRLLDAREYWLDKANTMGLKEWQEVLSEGKGGQPFYDLVAQEVAAQQEARNEAPELLTSEDLAEMEAISRSQQERDDRLEQNRLEMGIDLLEAEGIARAEWDSLRQEIAHDEALRREIWERGEQADRPTSSKSVLGYDLPEPSPAPPPDRTRGR